MKIPEILGQLRLERDRLDGAITALESLTGSKRKRSVKRLMSAAGRARIAAAQRARWAKVKKLKSGSSTSPNPRNKKRRRMSAAARERIAAAQRARWAKVKKAA